MTFEERKKSFKPTPEYHICIPLVLSMNKKQHCHTEKEVFLDDEREIRKNKGKQAQRERMMEMGTARSALRKKKFFISGIEKKEDDEAEEEASVKRACSSELITHY